MKNKSMALCLLSLLTVVSQAHADWQPTPAEESMAGAVSIGAGTLGVLATPLVFSGDVSDNKGLGTASAHSGRHLGEHLSIAGAGVYYLVDGTGNGLSELTTDSFQAAGVLAETTVDVLQQGVQRTQCAWQNGKKSAESKTIPLVVRPGYVQMHQKIGD